MSNSVESMDKMMKELRDKFPDFKIMIPTQPTRESGPIPRLDLGGSDLNIVIIDHINLIK